MRVQSAIDTAAEGAEGISKELGFIFPYIHLPPARAVLLPRLEIGSYAISETR